MNSKMQDLRLAAFLDAMRQQGYIEGRNLIVEIRWAEGRFDLLPALAKELIAKKVEVIVTAGRRR